MQYVHIFTRCICQFFSKAHHSLVAIRNMRQHFRTRTGRNFKQWNHQQKGSTCENHGTQYTSVQCESWEEKAECQLVRLRREHVHWVIRICDALHMSTSNHEVQRILILRSQVINLASKQICTYGIYEEWTLRESVCVYLDRLMSGNFVK